MDMITIGMIFAGIGIVLAGMGIIFWILAEIKRKQILSSGGVIPPHQIFS